MATIVGTFLGARCPVLGEIGPTSELSEYSEYSERKKEGPTRFQKLRAFNVSLSLGKLMLYQLSYSRSRCCLRG